LIVIVGRIEELQGLINDSCAVAISLFWMIGTNALSQQQTDCRVAMRSYKTDDDFTGFPQ